MNIMRIDNFQVMKYLMVTEKKIREYDNIVVSISGGSDSDIILDMFTKYDKEKKVKYVFFDTGLEYKATKRHLDYLEEKYNIKIERIRAKKPIPTCVKEYGVPVFSKHVSEMMSRLQKHNFKWEDEPYEVLIERYPNCKSAIEWWCNVNRKTLGISKVMKDFILSHPPTFKISNRCCDYAKKKPAKDYNSSHNTQLNVTGVRRSEGGIRATRYKSCFDSNDNSWDEYRPLFFFTDLDKEYYENLFDITHSDCYTVYGLRRTGCVGCPYSRTREEELEICKKYEPQLYEACKHIFGESYEYSRLYEEFKKGERK